MFINLLDDIPLNSIISIYGVGKRGLSLREYLKIHRKDVKIACFIDSFKNNEYIDELKVININELKEIDINFDFIVIASGFWTEILQELKKRQILNYKVLGFHIASTIESTINLIAHYQGVLFNNNDEKYKLKLDKILKLLDSDEDRNLYKKIYDIRTGKNELETLHQDYKDSQKIFYQYLDYINKDSIEILVDVGLYDSTGLDLFCRYFKNLKTIYGFEPLHELYCPNAKEMFADKNLELNIVAKGLYSHKSQFSILENFQSSTLTAMGVNNSRIINTISLNEFVQENNIDKIDLIKLDIEGSELPALIGAKNSLNKFRPQIAVAIYHSDEQFLDIPLFLGETLKNYTHKLAHYSASISETIWYSIPNELIKK